MTTRTTDPVRRPTLAVPYAAAPYAAAPPTGAEAGASRGGPPTQSYLFGHTPAEVVYDCRRP